MPVVLHVAGDVVVVGVGNDEACRRLAAADGDGEEHILVVHDAVAVVIEVGEVLHKFDRPFWKTPRTNSIEDALKLASELEVVLAVTPVDGVVELVAALMRALGNAVGGAVRDAGEIEFGRSALADQCCSENR